MGSFRFTIYRGQHVIEMGWCEASSKAAEAYIVLCSHCGTHLVLKSLLFFPSDLNHPARPYDLRSIFFQKSLIAWDLSVQTREPVGLILPLSISLGSAHFLCKQTIGSCVSLHW